MKERNQTQLAKTSESQNMVFHLVACFAILLLSVSGIILMIAHCFFGVRRCRKILDTGTRENTSNNEIKKIFCLQSKIFISFVGTTLFLSNTFDLFVYAVEISPSLFLRGPLFGDFVHESLGGLFVFNRISAMYHICISSFVDVSELLDGNPGQVDIVRILVVWSWLLSTGFLVCLGYSQCSVTFDLEIFAYTCNGNRKRRNWVIFDAILFSILCATALRFLVRRIFRKRMVSSHVTPHRGSPDLPTRHAPVAASASLNQSEQLECSSGNHKPTVDAPSEEVARTNTAPVQGGIGVPPRFEIFHCQHVFLILTFLLIYQVFFTTCQLIVSKTPALGLTQTVAHLVTSSFVSVLYAKDILFLVKWRIRRQLSTNNDNLEQTYAPIDTQPTLTGHRNVCDPQPPATLHNDLHENSPAHRLSPISEEISRSQEPSISSEISKTEETAENIQGCSASSPFSSTTASKKRALFRRFKSREVKSLTAASDSPQHDKRNIPTVTVEEWRSDGSLTQLSKKKNAAQMGTLQDQLTELFRKSRHPSRRSSLSSGDLRMLSTQSSLSSEFPDDLLLELTRTASEEVNKIFTEYMRRGSMVPTPLPTRENWLSGVAEYLAQNSVDTNKLYV